MTGGERSGELAGYGKFLPQDIRLLPNASKRKTEDAAWTSICAESKVTTPRTASEPLKSQHQFLTNWNHPKTS